MASDGSRAVRFGVFEVDLDARELWKRGVRVRLQDQPFRVLEALLEKPGKIVTREELKDRLWAQDELVEFDKSLNTAVQKIRQALGDSAENPRFLETVPRQGYKFIAPVTPSSGWGRPPDIEEARRPPYRALGLTAVVIGILAYALWPSQTAEMLEPGQFRQERLTTYEGYERGATFSPDGSQLAFSWEDQARTGTDIWVVVPGAAEPTRITDHPDPEFSPAWSPDGSRIAFMRMPPRSQEVEIWSISALGGDERKLTETYWPPSMRHVPQYGGMLSWSSDGARLAFAGRPGTEGPLRIQLLSLDTLQVEWLTDPVAEIVGDITPTISPRGDAIAFVRRVGVGSGHSLYVLPLADDYEAEGEPYRASAATLSVWSPLWTPEGRSILFLGDRVNQEGIWEVDRDGASEPRLIWPEVGARTLAIGQTPREGGFVLALEKETGQSDVWSIALRGPNAGERRPLLTSPSHETAPAFSPDGSRIAYKSMAVSDGDIWVCKPDGTEQRRVTRLGFRIVSPPQWSPDSATVAFHSRHEGQAELYIAEIETGNSRLISPDPADDALPVWGPNGRSLFFSSRRGGDWGVWRAPLDGGPATELIAPTTGRAQVDPAGAFVYYVHLERNTLCRRGLYEDEALGPEEHVLELEDWSFRSFLLGNGGVYFMESGVLRHLEVDNGEISDVMQLDRLPNSISPDGSTALYTKSLGRGTDLLLLTRGVGH